MIRIAALLVLLVAPDAINAQDACPQAAQTPTDAGWTAYRRNDMTAAGASFNAALRACPSDIGATVGMGYVSLRNNDVNAAKRYLDDVIARAPQNVDALVGRGIVAWREGDTESVRRYFERVRSIDPNNADAREYLGKLPQSDVAPNRPPFVRPAATVYPARTNNDHFEIRTATGWQPFYIKGMNLGAALPGKHPSEFPDSATYAEWLNEIGAMGVNTIRVYTIHPPHFYGALAAYNRAHRNAPLWIVHGVWTELPPEGNFDDAEWKGEFFQEMRYVVDLLHGRADIPVRPGHSSGHYTADVSQWVLAYIIGREWEPYAIAQFNAMSKRNGWHGTYLDMSGGTPSDAWMAEASETIVAYEMKAYNAQRPVAYTNWPTLDPLTHPTETTVEQEVAIRQAHGENVVAQPKEYDNDRFGLDANLVHPTKAFPAGWFASYHAYPYYPDFLVYDPTYAKATSSEGRSSYFGYLTALKQHHQHMPVVISEYGVPTSIGLAHFQPEGWNHGGLTEQEMAATDARLTREIAEAGMAGGMLFAWIDEWFKKNWIVIDFEIPLERNRLWHNRLDAEQHYGMIAMDAKPPVAGNTMRERLASWQSIRPLYQENGASLRAASDASYLWLLYTPATGHAASELEIGFDIVDPARGDTRWPGKAGAPLPVGLEFVLRARGDTVKLLVDSAANQWKLYPIRDDRPAPRMDPHIPATAPGFFVDRVEMRENATVGSVVNDDGAYASMLVIPNRRRFTRDSAEIFAIGYDRGILRQGNAPDGLWERLDDGTLEVRIPWMLLNFTDPSERRVLDDRGSTDMADLATSKVDGIRLAVRATDRAGAVTTWPSTSSRDAVALYQWPAWEVPQWQRRVRSVYATMRETLMNLNPASIH